MTGWDAAVRRVQLKAAKRKPWDRSGPRAFSYYFRIYDSFKIVT